jgi:hypothetical protein
LCRCQCSLIIVSPAVAFAGLLDVSSHSRNGYPPVFARWGVIFCPHSRIMGAPPPTDPYDQHAPPARLHRLVCPRPLVGEHNGLGAGGGLERPVGIHQPLVGLGAIAAPRRRHTPCAQGRAAKEAVGRPTQTGLRLAALHASHSTLRKAPVWRSLGLFAFL